MAPVTAVDRALVGLRVRVRAVDRVVVGLRERVRRLPAGPRRAPLTGGTADKRHQAQGQCRNHRKKTETFAG